MPTNRRDFLKLSALAGGSIGLGSVAGASALAKIAMGTGGALKPLRILILGGTGFRLNSIDLQVGRPALPACESPAVRSPSLLSDP